MPRRKKSKKSASKQVEEIKMSADVVLKLSTLQKYNWTVEKANALLGAMIGLKPAGIHKHLNILFIQKRLNEKINECIPTAAIWEFINQHWDTDAADKLEAQVILPIENKDFCLPQTDEWLKLIEEEEKKILKQNDFEKGNTNLASTINVCSDDIHQPSTSKVNLNDLNEASALHVQLNDAIRNKFTNEELIQMTKVRVVIEKREEPLNNKIRTD